MSQKKDLLKQRAFLAAFAKTCNITRASAAAKVHRTCHFRWMRDDTEYSAAFARAREEAITVLEDEAVRRAHEGIAKPVWFQGNEVGAVQEYSDSLLVVLLKAHKPDTYRENWKGEISGPGGGPIPLHDGRLEQLSDSELRELILIASKLTPSGDAES